MQTDLELKVRRKKEKLQQSNFNLRSRAVETQKKMYAQQYGPLLQIN